MRRTIRTWILPVGLLALAAVLRGALVFKLGTLWNDEAFSRHFALMPLGRMLDLLRFDVHPPLHAILLHYWMMIFGSGVIGVRSMSWAFAVAGLAVFFLMARDLFGRPTALLALLLASLSPIAVYYGADGRMYSAVFLLACLSAWFFWKFMKGDERYGRPWFWLSLALALTHVVGPLVLMGQAAFGLRTAERRARFRRLLPALVLIAAVFLLWLAPAAMNRLGTVSGEWQFAGGEESRNAAWSLVYWLWLGRNTAAFVLILICLGLFILAGVLRRTERRPHFRVGEESEFLLWWLLFAFAPFLALSAAPPRYLIAAVPAFFLLVCHGFLSSAGGRRWALVLGTGAIIFLTLPGLAVQLSTRPYGWDKVVDWIKERGGAQAGVVLEWYADRLAFEATAAAPFGRDVSGMTVDSLYPFDDALGADERLVAHAGTLALSSADFGRLAPYFAGRQAVFFVPNYYVNLRGGGSASEALNAWFRANGWYLVDKLDAQGRTPGVWLMVKR